MFGNMMNMVQQGAAVLAGELTEPANEQPVENAATIETESAAAEFKEFMSNSKGIYLREKVEGGEFLQELLIGADFFRQGNKMRGMEVPKDTLESNFWKYPSQDEFKSMPIDIIVAETPKSFFDQLVGASYMASWAKGVYEAATGNAEKGMETMKTGVGMGTTNVGVMNGQGVPLYNINVGFLENCTPCGCVANTYSKTTTVTDTHTDPENPRVIGYVRNALPWAPNNECGDFCLPFWSLYRCLFCCAGGHDIYNADDEWIFRLQDGWKCCGGAPCSFCGYWANACAPGGDFSALCCCVPFCCRYTQYVYEPEPCTGGMCGLDTGLVSKAEDMNCFNGEGCCQPEAWIRCCTDADNYSVAFPDHELFNNNLDNRLLLFTAGMIQHSGDFSAENTQKVEQMIEW